MESKLINDEEILAGLLAEIPGQVERLSEVREELLANAVMLGEIPAPTFGEEDRIRFVIDRFRENDLVAPTIDDCGNASALLPGSEGENTILVMAHADNVFDHETNHAMCVGSDRIIGPGIADNAIGLSSILTLPALLDSLGLKLKDDLLLLANVKSLGRGNLEGAHHFLETTQRPFRAGICVEGATQGRLSYSGLGALRCEISLRIPGDYDWNRFGASGAIAHLSRLVGRIMEIPVPREPKTSVVFGGLRCGSTYNTVPKRGSLRFEIASESDTVVTDLESQVRDLSEEFSLESGTEVKLEIVARRPNCGIPFTHPLVKTTRAIMDSLGITPKVDPSTGDLNAIVQAGHPGVTLGLTTAENLHDENETVLLEPLFKGLAQLIAILRAIDEGLCDA
jgi:tripeptide aminopeptidase